MNTALLLLSSVVGHGHCPQPYPYYYPYFYNPYSYNVRLPVPDSLRPPNFQLYPAPPQPKREVPAVQVPANTYQGVMPLVIENPYYKAPAK